MFKTKKQTTILRMRQEIEATKLRMDTMHNNFQNAVDPDLIDSYIFETNAAWKRYQFLIKEMREHNSAS